MPFRPGRVPQSPSRNGFADARRKSRILWTLGRENCRESGCLHFYHRTAESGESGDGIPACFVFVSLPLCSSVFLSKIDYNTGSVTRGVSVLTGIAEYAKMSHEKEARSFLKGEQHEIFDSGGDTVGSKD